MQPATEDDSLVKFLTLPRKASSFQGQRERDFICFLSVYHSTTYIKQMLSWFSEKTNQGWGIGEEEESQLGPLKAERVGCVFSVHVVVAVYGEVYLQNWLWP